MLCRTALFVALCLILPTTAFADDTFAPPSSRAPHVDVPAVDEPETETQWYGYQTLSADALAWTVVLTSGDESSIWGLYTAAPLVHALNGELGRAVGSIGLRVGATFIGALVGPAFAGDDCDSDTDFCIFPDAVFEGALVGLIATQLLDGIWYANKQVEKPERWITPTASVRDGGGTVGIAGSF